MHRLRSLGRRLAHTKSLNLVGQRQPVKPKMSGVEDLDALRAAVTKAGGTVRQLKAEGAEPARLQAAIDELQTLRKKLDLLSANEEDVNKWKVNKKALEDTLTRRMFVVPAFEIHGGVAGLYDYGPPGCALKENILQLWRQHFVLEDNMLQIECTTLTPYPVLKASGHVDKFEDLMVKDVKTGECYRADKLLEDFIDNLLRTDKTLTSDRRDELRKIAAQADAYEPNQLHALFQELKIKAPATGNDLTEPFPFNLMFQTSIGPSGAMAGFLRPETAQGMFVNFRRLYDYNNGKMPMAVAQIGSAYRNEIAPRGGLIRVREFTMAEIEYFVHPNAKDHAKFDTVKDMQLNLFPSDNQLSDGKTINPTVGEAVGRGIINNQTLAYFMARTAQFMYRIGVKPEGLRFRQHLKTEMAHYACDCWDAEILMAQGWVECVGHADRSAYDLQVHTKATKVDLIARELLPEPVEEEYINTKVSKKLLGGFKQDVPLVNAWIEEIAAERPADALATQEKLTAEGQVEVTLSSGKTVTITKDMVSFTKEKRRVLERKYVPNVIEPSFGIGRIITGVFEHNFYSREGDEQRAVLAFKPIVAPFKAVILPLDARIDKAIGAAISSTLTKSGLSAFIDESGASVGKRYARADEIGVPYAVTVDHDTKTDGKVTVRDRDSTSQIRVSIEEVPKIIRALVEESESWQGVSTKYGLVTPAAGAAEDK